MINNLSLISLLAISVLTLVMVPITVFAAPVFETDTDFIDDLPSDTFYGAFAPEQSIAYPFYDDWLDTQISDLDVVVMANATDQTLQEVFVIYTDQKRTTSTFLSYTNNLILGPTGLPYFVDSLNTTQTVLLSENDREGGTQLGSVCNDSSLPKISVTDSHVFVTWRDQGNADCSSDSDRIAALAINKTSFADLTTDPFYDSVDNSPAYFDTNDEPTLTYSMTANGTNAYIVWENSTSVNFISFDGASFSTGGDTGAGFGDDVILDRSDTAAAPDVIVESTSPYDIHAAWHDTAGDTNITLATTTDNFATNSTSSLGTSNVISENVKLAETGGTVYTSWTEGSDFTQQLFIDSSDNANPPLAISDGTGKASDHQIIADGTNVFAVWQETIGAFGNGEILFSSSDTSGVSFGTPINLSDSSGDSILPKISGNSDDVNIVWRDNTFLPLVESTTDGEDTDGQVWFKSYDVTSASSSGLQVISESTNSTNGEDTTFFAYDSGDTVSYPAPIPNISSSDDVVVSVWNPDFDRAVEVAGFNIGNWDGSMKAAIPKEIDISFNSTEYLSPRNATITVVDTSESGTVTIDLQRREGSFETFTLNEEGSTGIFSNTFELYNGTLNLDGSPGDIFTAKYTDDNSIVVTTQAKIQDTRILDFLTPDGSSGVFTHDLGNVDGLRLTDAKSNDDPGDPETVVITITSDVDSDGTTITLEETGADTGIFEVMTGGGLIFMDGPTTPEVGDALGISQESDLPGTGGIDTITRHVNSTTDPTGVDITLTETSANSDEYTGTISICDSSDPKCKSPNINATDGDFLRLSSPGGSVVSNGMVIPKVDERAAIEVSCTLNDCGTVTATYNGLDVSINVKVTSAGGGGGGGVSRAGLVVNALAGLSSSSFSVSSSAAGGGGGVDGTPPTTSLGLLITNRNFDAPDEIVKIVETSDSLTPLQPIPTSKFADFDLPLTINENGYPLGGYSNTIKTFSADMGKPLTITTLYYEQTVLQHVSMYMNLRDNTKGDLSKSDTQILYNKGKPLEIIDSNGFFEKVSVNIIEDDETIKKFAEFEITFAKPMETSDIVLRSWDDRLRSGDTIIFDAIQVVGSENSGVLDDNSESGTVEALKSTDALQDVQQVPDWIKNNAEWWSQGAINDDTFKNGIQFLIQEKIINVPTGPNVSISPDDELSEEELKEQNIQIPDWIKNNAEWWSQGAITEDAFLKSIEYLVKNGIIQI